MSDLPTYPHVYTAGDRLPAIVAAFKFDISAFTIFAVVERPDGTSFEREMVNLNAQQTQLNLLATDLIKGCTQLTLRVEDGSGKPSHTPPIIIPVKPKPEPPT